MDHQHLASHASRFAINAPVAAVEPLGSGNVNDTYRVRTTAGDHYVLQRINTRVFRQPELVMANLAALTEHVEARHSAGTWADQSCDDRPWDVPRPIPLADGSANWLLSNGEAWRMLSFVDDATSLDTIDNPEQAQEVGRALGTFHRLIHDLPAERLADTLEGFHITPGYLAAYGAARATSAVERCAASRWCEAFIADRQGLAPVLEDAKASGRLQLRPIHGDPKVNNVMLCTSSGRAVALVDLDTVKPGLVHYDIGDCLRSACNPLGEETDALDAVQFDLNLAERLLHGYLSVARGFLSDADLDAIPDAIALLPFELGLRFLTDHLAGDTYFTIARPGHNLDRALVQFRLAESVERQRAQIQALVEGLR